jgi:hypothetical protein
MRNQTHKKKRKENIPNITIYILYCIYIIYRWLVVLPSPVVGLLLASPEIGMCHVPWSSQSWAGREDSHYTAATEMWAMAQWHMKEKPEMPGSTGTIKIWLVVSNMIFIFHNIWDVILPMTFIFFKMVKTTNQIRMMSGNHVVLDLYFPSPI